MKRQRFSPLPSLLSPWLSLGVLAAASPVAAIDLAEVGAGTGGFVINGATAGDWAAYSVSGAGDVNGDGLDDLILGAPRADAGASDTREGAAWVVLGRTGTTVVSLSDVTNGTGGFVIRGAAAGDQAGAAVGAAGDWNGDGLADVLVGAPLADTVGRPSSGRTYVVLGRTATTPVSLLNVGAGSGGFVINGATPSDESGSAVASVRDMNGDGRNELLIGAPELDTAGYSAGGVYVVFGQTTSANIELSAVAAGTGGFVVNGAGSLSFAGSDLDGLADYNGDGLGDLAIASPNARSAYATDSYSGAVYVVFGRSNGSPAVALTAVTQGTGGQAIVAGQPGERTGSSISAGGDVNGDGLSDIVAGASLYDLSLTTDTGSAFVHFGTTESPIVNLGATAVRSGFTGFAAFDSNAQSRLGTASGGGTDMDGDGFADLLLAIPTADPPGRIDAGRSVVMFGKTSGTAIDFDPAFAGTGGFGIEGAAAADLSGGNLASVGDLNGDGRADLVIASPKGTAPAGAGAGRLWVVFNAQPQATSASYATVFPANAAPTIAIGAQGNATRAHGDSRATLKFDTAPSPALVTATIHRNGAGVSGLTAPATVAWQISSARTGSATVRLRYLDTEIGATPEGTLKMFRAADPAGPWTELTGLSVDAARNTISASTTSLGWFAIATGIGAELTFDNDADGDGYSDLYESLRGSSHLNPASVPNPRLGDIDADNDVDADDVAALAAAIANGTALDVNRAGIVDDNVAGNIADDTIYNAADTTQLGNFTTAPKTAPILR